MIDVVIHGVREFDSAIDGIVSRSVEATREATVEAAHVVQLAIQERAGEGGRHRLGTPTPAVQGRGPAVITGTLRRSIIVKSGPTGRGGWRAQIGPTAIYGRRIELEYHYPYVGPGLTDALPEVRGIYEAKWAEAQRS